MTFFPTKRSLLRLISIALFTLTLSGCTDEQHEIKNVPFQGEIRVGILHSQSGTMAFSEGTAAEGEVLAIEEINDRGGISLDGKRLRVVPVVADGASDPKTFADQARKLIDEEKVSAVFGGWTSASRKAMLPVFEARNRLLFYPIQYEGQECSPNIIYGGATPNQQIEPALEWLLRNKGNTFFLIGSDYVYPRTANRIIRAMLTSRGATIVGEAYIPLGNMDVDAVVASIQHTMPKGGIILNTLNGDSNTPFFKALKKAYLTPANGYITMSFSIAEEEVFEIGPENLEGTYASRNFFQALDTHDSRRFTKDFKFRFGQRRVTSDPTESGYTLVHLWALGVEKAGSVETSAVRDALVGLHFDAPEGTVLLRPNHHMKRPTLIGEIQTDGMFKIVASMKPIEPMVWNTYLPEEKEERCATATTASHPKSLHPR
jgi:urea transport system substrate-binding protein